MKNQYKNRFLKDLIGEGQSLLNHQNASLCNNEEIKDLIGEEQSAHLLKFEYPEEHDIVQVGW